MTKSLENRSIKVKADINQINNILNLYIRKKQKAKTPNQAIKILLYEQEYLCSLKNYNSRILKLIKLSKKYKKEKIIMQLKKALKANQIQGIKSDAELTKILSNPYNSVFEINKQLQQLVEDGQNSILHPVKIQLDSLLKLNYKFNCNSLVKKLKNKTYEEKDQYMDEIVASQVKKYIYPLIALHTRKKSKAKNIEEVIKVVEKEYKIYLNIYEHHKISLSSLEEIDNMKLIALAEDAYNFDNIGGINALCLIINHIIDKKIKTKKLIFKELKYSNTNIYKIFCNLQNICYNHYINIISRDLEKLNNNMTVSIGRYTFKDSISYLNHLQNYRDYKYLPIYYVKENLQKIKNQQKYN
ncbi:MAG: hypothetical protein AB8B66_04230 [Rickettsiaceae bacterium]